jgi:adenylate cyclase
LQSQAIQEHHGVVDKLIGDAVMAFWGVPFVRDDEHAALACRAALAQITALELLRRELPQITGQRTGGPEIDLCIGICSGEVVVGNIGSENARSFTVIGDTVNVASRIESANRIYGTHVLLGETTAQEVGGAFELREIDAITAKGKTEPVKVYELLGVAGSTDAARLFLRDKYSLALAAYRAQDWEAAERLFGECTGLDPRDRASRLMLDRVKSLRGNPPGAGWDGVWRLHDK